MAGSPRSRATIERVTALIRCNRQQLNRVKDQQVISRFRGRSFANHHQNSAYALHPPPFQFTYSTSRKRARRQTHSYLLQRESFTVCPRLLRITAKLPRRAETGTPQGYTLLHSRNLRISHTKPIFRSHAMSQAGFHPSKVASDGGDRAEALGTGDPYL